MNQGRTLTYVTPQLIQLKTTTSIQIADARIFLAKDGTEVQDEEYFSTLEPQTLFIVAKNADEVKTGTGGIYGQGRVYVTSNYYSRI